MFYVLEFATIVSMQLQNGSLKHIISKCTYTGFKNFTNFGKFGLKRHHNNLSVSSIIKVEYSIFPGD